MIDIGEEGILLFAMCDGFEEMVVGLIIDSLFVV
jgi:hypothetical protein